MAEETKEEVAVATEETAAPEAAVEEVKEEAAPAAEEKKEEVKEEADSGVDETAGRDPAGTTRGTLRSLR